MSLLIAFSSYRARDYLADIYFYRHDGVRDGELLGSLPTESPRLRSDYRPWLTADGRTCAFSCQYHEVNPGELRLWDLREKRLIPLPDRNPNGADTMGAISGDGRYLAFAGWKRPGGLGGYDLFMYDLDRKALVPLPGLNSDYDEEMPALSHDGHWLAFTSNQPSAPDAPPAVTNIRLYDSREQKLVPLPGCGAPGCRDTQPSLCGNGRYLAFMSDRPDPGSESRSGNIHLYDRQTASLVPLPGLNSAAHDSQPAISPGGRFIVFASDRMGGAGQQDVYLYDRREAKLLPTPGLNHAAEDFEPAVVVLAPEMDRI